MSNKLSKTVKSPDRFAIDAAKKKKAEEAEASRAMNAGRKIAESQRKAGILDNWKVTTAINLVIAVVFITLAVTRYNAGASLVYIILLAVFGLINLGCALWSLKNFPGNRKQTPDT